MLQVHQLYNDVLHRNADNDGIYEYSNLIRLKRGQVDKILRESDEYKKNDSLFYQHDGISLCCAAMNRWNMLSQSLPTWLKCNDINEILILDYGSTETIYSKLKQYNIVDSRIKIINVIGVKSWCLSKAYNIAIYNATYNKIIKMDTDYLLINSNFFKEHILSQGMFYAGNWRNSRNENEDHLNGFIYIYKHDFFYVNGYSEHILTYGRDDEDLYERLRLIKIKRNDIKHNYIEHIPHDDSLRIQEQQLNTKCCHDEIIYNENIKQWSINDHRDTHYSIQASKNLFYNSQCPFFIFRPHHGLGNRLRALMSALQYVQKYNMCLIFQWPIDVHFGCKFNDLFIDSFPHIDVDIDIPFDLGGDKYNYVNDDEHNNKDSPIVFLNRSIFVKSNCILEFEGIDYLTMKKCLQNLTVCHDIKKSVKHFEKYTIGVHIRMDNKLKNKWELPSNYTATNYDQTKTARSKCHYSNFIAEMIRLEDEIDCDWFITTDTPTIIPRMKSIFGANLHHNINTSKFANHDVVDRSCDSIKSAFADMLTLSNCNALLGSTWSSFTEVAEYFKSTKYDFIKIVGTDF
uniref:Galactosyltransferase C-terminal domain-containing protein n=1 Tax=viral metagenome TaxID=1070528 RepID=A0A6C0FDF3_9ZZZZ|tara:strand:+ start:1143 stop:2858 length:1716 start_codon:yes stop_codon:yes gene_type:complete